jgi:dimethylglycine dehydrogenase
MNSLRLEKGFGIWSAEFTQDRTPGMTGMDRWIDWSRDDFIGHDAAAKERSCNHVQQHLVTLEIDADDADASGYEPIWQGDQRVGFVTSGGYGHHTGKSLAMGLLKTGADQSAEPLKVDVVGNRRGARTLSEPAWDPSGARMRL